MKINFFSKVLLFWLLISSCSRIHPNEESKVLSLFPDFVNKQIIVIIPGDGCSVCINEAETYLEEFIDDERFGFIFSAIYNYKDIKIKYRHIDLKKSNVAIDKDNLLVKHKILLTSPILIFIDNKRVVRMELLEYDNFKSARVAVLDFLN
ncbi:MAG: hypothetical protein JXR68_13270 [Bacteroidales bacterium]|nr:hypothetical protein [Bacteroidales bacterium]